jgi:hypothetical protein
MVHLYAAMRTLRYFVDTADLVLRYERGRGVRLMGATDSSWRKELEAKSRGAYLFKAFGAAVSWQSKKIAGVSLSSCEAEYKALTEGAKEAIWLQRLMEEVGIWEGGPVTIKVDNQAAISLAKNPVLHQRTKHISLYWHFIREAIEDGHVRVEFVRTREQEADALTKPLVGAHFKETRARFGLFPKRPTLA